MTRLPLTLAAGLALATFAVAPAFAEPAAKARTEAAADAQKAERGARSAESRGKPASDRVAVTETEAATVSARPHRTAAQHWRERHHLPNAK